MLVGHQKQWHYLKESAAKRNIAHAYLFYGPPKTGKKTIALRFAKVINCYNSETKPCNECQSCKEIDNNISSNLFFLKEAEDKKQIHISQIRELKAKMSLSAAGGGHKVAIIDASQINVHAQGALLKLLEEPKGQTAIILVAERINQFLPTIISRCQVLRFSLVAKEEIKKFLIESGADEEEAKEVAALSFGRPGLALEMLTEPKIREFQKRKIEDIKKLSKSLFSQKFQYAQNISKNSDQLYATIEIWLNYFRALLLQQAKRENFSKESPGQCYSSQRLRDLIIFLEKIRILLLTTNINPKIAIEAFLIKV